MALIAGLVTMLLAALALRGRRWAYATFVALGLLYFPVRAGLPLRPRACELTPSLGLLAVSLHNWAHVVLFAAFYVMSLAQWPATRRGRWVWAFGATLAMGALVELAQGVTGRGHCRVRDLLPDAMGATLGALGTLAWRRLRASGLAPRRAANTG